MSEPPIVTLPASGIEEPEQQVDDGRLAGAALADQCDAAAGREHEIESVQHGWAAGGIPRGHVLERDGGRGRRRSGRLGVGDRARPLDQLQHAATGGDRGGELLRRGGERRHALERCEREERDRGDEDAIERARRVRRHRDREDAHRRQPGDEDEQARREPGREGVAPRDARELGVGLPDALDALGAGAVEDELGSAAQELDEVGGQLAAALPPPRPGRAAERAGEQRHADPRDQKADAEDEAGDRKDHAQP